MKRIVACAAFLLSFTALAQQYPYGDRGYRDRDGYRDDRRFSLVDRVLADLDRIDARAWVDHHERDHFAHARNDLYSFRGRWQTGRFDTGLLDRAINNMKHLANSRELAPGARGAIARDIDDLRVFRGSYGGYRR